MGYRPAFSQEPDIAKKNPAMTRYEIPILHADNKSQNFEAKILFARATILRPNGTIDPELEADVSQIQCKDGRCVFWISGKLLELQLTVTNLGDQTTHNYCFTTLNKGLAQVLVPRLDRMVNSPQENGTITYCPSQPIACCTPCCPTQIIWPPFSSATPSIPAGNSRYVIASGN